MRAGVWIIAALTATVALPATAAAESAVIGPPDLIVPPSALVPGTTCSRVPMSCQWFGEMNTALGGGTITAPADGHITSWRAIGAVSGAGQLTLNVAHPLGDGSFLLTATTPPAPFVNGSSNALTPPLAITAGDSLSVAISNQPFDGSSGSARLDHATSPGGSVSGLPALSAGSSATPTTTTADEVALYNATAELDGPQIESMSVQSGPETGGTTVTIAGSHLAIATGVTFGGVPAQSFSGDNTTITAVSPPQAPGVVDVQVSTAGGASPSTAAGSFTYELVDNGQPPALDDLTVAPKKFLAGNLGGSIIGLKAAGTTVRYTLSEPATVTFAASRVTSGRKVRGQCVKPTRKNRDKPKCKRFIVKGSFTHDGSAGANEFLFSGRINNKALKPGKYQLSAVATDLVGVPSATPAKTSFEITKPN